ncbi:MAG TPA: PadR family transcriptional regulator [Bryobacteraceae bacterium]|nr:PadR family transcriptional regulator [Bryobacteraceae bacterium]
MRHEHWSSQGSFWPWASLTFGGRSRFFGSGEVRLAILSLLSEGPKHGYQLMKELAERSGGIYRASAGSVYPTLQQLEDEELIASDTVSGKRAYHLTEAGLRELEKDPEGVKRIWERAEKWEEFGQCMNPEVIPMMRPLVELGRVAWKAAARVRGNREKEDRMRDIFDQARRDLEGL